MYQFTTETIINSNKDSNGVLAKFSGANGVFSVSRVGNYKAVEVLDCYKNPYAAPVKAKVTKTIAVNANPAKVYRLYVELNRVGSNTADFAKYLSRNGMEKFYEVTGVTGASALATAFVAAIKKENVFKDNIYIVPSNTNAELVLEVTDEYNRFVKVEIQEVVNTSLTGYDSFTVLENVLSGATVVEGTEGFGTIKQITKNLRLPTLANTSINQEERPIPGGEYTQYSIRIKTNRPELGGNNAVGQEIKSVTSHIFYVLGTLVSAFETALGNAGITILAGKPGAGALKLTYDDAIIVVGDKTTPTLTGAVGAVTYTSATAGVATVVGATGVVTGVSAGTSVITATDAAGNTGTFTVTVIA